MADSKITALAALTAADPVNDMFPVVDVSDTSMAASGTTKRISANNILSSSPTASGALTVTGLVTAGSATITGDLTVDTSTLKVDSTNNRVGIGTATPSGLLTLNQASGAYSLNMDGGGFGTMASFGIVNVGISNDAYIGTVGNNDFLIRVANSTRATFDQNGHFNLANGNVVMATSGKGIDFSATSSVGTSELLNDYEEGTWLPTAGAVANLTSVVVYTASYTKVGRLVTLIGSVTATVTSSNIQTYFTLPSLPFANNGTTTGAVQENGNLTIGAVQVASSNLYGFFPAASAVVSGAATFNYNVTYSV